MIKLHPKQYEIFANEARFRVVTAGRRFGKCLSGDTLVSMADGSEKLVADIRPGDWVLTVNEDTYKLESKQVKHLHDNGVKETVVVDVRGHSLRCTPNHPILANNTWINAGDLKKGDLVAVPRKLAFGSKRIPQHELDFLAIWLAEGRANNISNGTKEILDLLHRDIEKIDPDLHMTLADPKTVDWKINRRDGVRMMNGAIFQLLKKYGVWGLDSKTKFIPDVIFELEKDQVARFLNLFFACDGCITHKSKQTWGIEIGLANLPMVKQIQKLLMKFGIHGSIYHKIHKAKSKISGECFQSWTFATSDPQSLLTYGTEIGALSKEKQIKTMLASLWDKRENCNRYLPIPYEEFIKHLKYDPVDRGNYGGYNALLGRDLPDELRASLNTWRKQDRNRCTFKRYLEIRKYTDGYFDSIFDGDLVWQEVSEVRSSEPVQTWDLTIEGNHNFVANGLITHNTIVSKACLIKEAGIPNRRVWYVSPSYRMSKSIMWYDLLADLPKKWVKKVNETTMTIWLRNGSVIELKGCDKPDALRGVGLHFVVLDEVQDMKEEVWFKVLRPTLATTRGRVLMIGTPKRKDFFYELWKRGQSVENQRNKTWHSWQFTTIDSPFISPEEIEQARRDLDQKSFEQEFLAHWANLSGVVYYCFDRDLHVGDYPFNPTLPIWIGQDFNIDPMSSTILQPQPNGEVWVVDEIYLASSNVVEVCEEIQRRYWRYQSNITIYPDPAARSKQHAKGESSLDIFREHGFKKLKYRRYHPAVVDRVNAVNRMLRSADGSMLLKVDKKCRHLIDSFEKTLYCEKSPDIDKKLGMEHMCFSGDQLVQVNGVLTRFDQIPEKGFVKCHDGIDREYVNGGLIKEKALMLSITLSNGRIIKCTDDHQFLTTDGWVQAKNLKGKQLCNQELLATLFKNTTDSNTISAVEDTFKEMGLGFIAKFGKIIMEKSPLDTTITYITKTATSRTTLSKILNCLRDRSTYPTILEKTQERSAKTPEKGLLLGTKAQKVLSGIKSIMRTCVTNFMRGKTLETATIVTPNIVRHDLLTPSIAPENASLEQEDSLGLITRRELARSVVQSFQSIDTKKQKHAVALAPIVLELHEVGTESAYCLTVPDFGMFEIDGVIVSNCDSLGYAIDFEFPVRQLKLAGRSF